MRLPLSANGSQYDTEDSRFFRQILEDYQDPECRHLTLMCASQSGKTAAAMACLLWRIGESPCGAILWVVANEAEAKKLMKTRMASLFEGCAPVASKLPDAKSAKTMLERHFPGSPFIVASAKSFAATQSLPIGGGLFLDEVRLYPEGTVSALEKRTRSFPFSTIFMLSTPGDLGDEQSRAYDAGSQHLWFADCPNAECNQSFNPSFDLLDWTEDETTRPDGETWDFDAVASTVRMVCPHCQTRIADEIGVRKALGTHGEWMAQNPDAARAKRSYHFEACLPWWVGWPSIVQEYIQARAALENFGDASALRTFITETRGIPWHPSMADLGADSARDRIYEFDPSITPDHEIRRLLTVDVQAGKRGAGMHFIWMLTSWGEGPRCDVLGWGTAHNEAELAQIQEDWEVPSNCVGLDTAFASAFVYDLCHRHGWNPMRGSHRTSFKRKNVEFIWSESVADLAIGTAAAGVGPFMPLTIFSKPSCLERASAMLNGTLGDLRIPASLNEREAFMQQLTAYRRRSITDRRGNTIHEWYSSRPKDDHLADCYNMAVCIASITGLIGSAQTQPLS